MIAARIAIFSALLIFAGCATRNDGMGSLYKGVGCAEGTLKCQ